MAISSSPISSAPISGTSGAANDTSLAGAAAAAATATGILGALIDVAISYSVSAPAGTVVCPLTIAVSSDGMIDAALSITVTAGGLEGAAQAVAMAQGSLDDVFLTVPLRIDVLLPGYFGTPATRWRPVVSIGGTDYSSRLTGELLVEANESEARIAELSLLPSSGAIAPSLYLGKSVHIDYAVQQTDGSALYPQRLFTGIVEAFEYDAITRLTKLRCTDDLQARVARLTTDQIDTLVGGYWSDALLSGNEDNWEYAMLRLSTVSSALDGDAYGNVRVTAWESKATADYAYTEALIEDGSLGVEWAQRTDLRNKITLSFEYRFHRLKVRVARFLYYYPFTLAEILTNLYTIPTVAMFEQALQSTGWEIVGEPRYVYPPKGPEIVEVYYGGQSFTFVWICSDQDLAATTTIQGSGNTPTKTTPNIAWAFGDEATQKRLFFQAIANVKRRYAQRVTETYTLTVSHADSIAAFGEQAEDEKANMDSEFDAGNWESWRPPAKPSGASATGTVQEPLPVITPPAIGETYQDYMPDEATDRDAAEAVMRALIARAQSRIRATHRLNSVRCTVPLDPTLDLIHTCSVTSTNVTAQGKLRRLTHRMSIESGRAVTEIELAISSTGGAEGTDSAATAPAAPAVPDPTIPYSSDLIPTWVGNNGSSSPEITDDMWGYFTNIGGTISRAADGPVYPIQFTIEAPEIPAVDRDNLVTTVPADYTAKIPIDTFTVTA